MRVFYTVTKADIYAASYVPTRICTIFPSLHFSSHTLPISRGRPLTLHLCRARQTFLTIFWSIPECRLYCCCYLHSVPVCCSSTVTQGRPHHSFVTAGYPIDVCMPVNPRVLSLPVVSPSLQYRGQKESDQQMLGKYLSHVMSWMKQQPCKKRKLRSGFERLS